MNKILEMREKRVNLWNAAKAFLDTHQNSEGLMSAEDTATYEKMENDVVAMGKAIERLERQEAVDLEMDKTVGTPIVDAPSASPVAPEKKGRASDEYKSSFWSMIRNKSLRPDVQNYLQIGLDANGGYLVPDEFEHTLIDALEEENVLRRIGHVFRTNSGDHVIPVVASHGTASWIAEGAPYPETDDTFTQVVIGAHKLATMLKISEELLNDSAFNMEAYISKEFARRAGAAEEDAFLTGDGAGKPTGLLDATGGAQIGVTAASATAITADELIDLFYSLRAPYRKNAVWLLNDSTIKAIRKLKNGTQDYLWQPALTANTPDTLLNRPVYTSPFMPAIATGKSTILFGDFNYYWIGDRVGRSFKRLNELYAANGQVGFLSSERVDAKLILPEAVKALKQA